MSNSVTEAAHQDMASNAARPRLGLSVVVPTYREAANLPVLVPRLCAALELAGISAEVIIVDDNSPDDTAAVCQELQQSYPLRLEIRRNERGLSSAVVHGLNLADGQVAVVMDADLSHPPESVPQLVAALDERDVDFVIGSRYVDGGSTDDGWGLLRWINSKAATLLARPLTTAKDPMAGFFAIRTDRFRKHQQALDPIGYKIGLELIVKCDCRKIAEVPIAFQNRLHGESKLTLREQVNYVRHVGRLMKHKYYNFVSVMQFGAVGLVGMAIDLSTYALLLTIIPLFVARALAISAAMTCNYFLNRQWTFSHARSTSIVWQYVLFCAGCGLGACLNWGISVGLVERVSWFAGHPLWAAAIGVASGFVVNYLFSRTIAFRASRTPLER